MLAEAVMQKVFRGVADVDQAWILGELIRYLEHRKSGALEFEDMGESWVPVREAVTAGTLRATDKSIPDVVARFDAMLRFASLHLGRQLGTGVVPVLSRKELADPTVRAQALTAGLCQTGQLSGSIRIPGTVGHLVVTTDLRTSRASFHVDLEAPREGRGTTRVNWLVRQLKQAPPDLRIEAFVAHGRGTSAAELLSAVREDPATLLTDPTRELRAFRISASRAVGTKRGRGRGSFIDAVLGGIDDFYREVLENLRAWSAAPPRLRERQPPQELTDESVPPSLRSTDYSSQDETQSDSGFAEPLNEFEEDAPPTGEEAHETADAPPAEMGLDTDDPDDLPKAPSDARSHDQVAGRAWPSP